jgi:pyruvate/2-oxoglutarate/acetoin dehydrogenase E1 component
MAEMTMVQAIRTALAHELERDPSVVVLGEDVGYNGGVFRATEGLQARFGEQRVVDTPLAELGIAGAAVGLAASGMTPVAEIQFLGFAYQAFCEIAGQAARFRMRSQGRFPMRLTIRSPYGGGVRAPELHSDALETLFIHSPGLKVVAPGSAADAYGLLISAIRDPDPVIFLEPLRGYRGIRGEVTDDGTPVPIGPARRVRTGGDVSVFAWSAMVPVAEAAAARAATEGIDCEVIDLRTLAPLDEETVADSVARTGRAVVIHEAPRTGGFGAELAATIMERCFLSLEAPVVRVTAFDLPYPVGMYEDRYIPNVDRALDGIRRAARY